MKSSSIHRLLVGAANLLSLLESTEILSETLLTYKHKLAMMFPCIHMQIVMNFWKNSPMHTDPKNTRLRLLFSSCSRSSKQLVPEFEFSDLLFYLKVTSSGTCRHQWRQYTVLLVYTSSGMVSLALTSWYNLVFVEWLAAYAELSTKTKMTIWRPKKTSWKRALQLLEIPGR